MKMQNDNTEAQLPIGKLPAHVVITGATSGLGWALAERYAASGRILSLGGRNEERLAAIASICAEKGAQVHTTKVDVTDSVAMQDWLLERDTVQPIDILFANAGMGGAAVLPPSGGEDGPLAREIISVNTMGVVNSVTPILPRMLERKAGHLVLVGSITGAIGLPQSPAYCASKAAVQIYGDALRRLVGYQGVRVTNVLPGFMDTPMSRSLEMSRAWCWSAEKSADRIARDVSRGAAQSIFPWQLRMSIGLQRYLPIQLTDFILSTSARIAGPTAKKSSR